LVWNILCVKPPTRTPYKERAKSDSFTKDADEAWKNLRSKKPSIVALKGNYFVGAEEKNAEQVPFKDQARFHLLLRFWPFVAQIYIPTNVIYDRKTKSLKTDFIPYALAIPDVISLKTFCDEIEPILRNKRGSELVGNAPRESIVDMASESALDLSYKLSQSLALKAGNQSTSDLISGIDVIHIHRKRENAKLLYVARISPTQTMIDEYARVKGMFRYALFRHQRLLNVLNECDWFNGFDKLICTTDLELTIGSYYFRADVRAAFKDSIQSNQSMKGEQDEVDTSDSKQTANQSSVEDLVYQLVSTYIRAKLKSKHELEWSDAFKGTEKEREYNEKKTKIAKDAFLSVRSRTGDDFIEYFVSTLCSFPQFLSEEGYATIAQALHTDTDKVRTLTLLALSARG
jgi:CRISPR-associated protein Cmx8